MTAEAIQSTLRRAFSWRLWLRGLIGAVLGALSNGVSAMLIDPEKFNVFDRGDWRALLSFCVASGIVSAALYIKTHPIPAPEDNPPTP